MTDTPLTRVDDEFWQRVVELRPEVGSVFNSDRGLGRLPVPTVDGNTALRQILREWRDAREKVDLDTLPSVAAHQFKLDQAALSGSLALMEFGEDHAQAAADPDVVGDLFPLLLADATATHIETDVRAESITERLLGLADYLAAARETIAGTESALVGRAQRQTAWALAEVATFATGKLSPVGDALEGALATSLKGAAEKAREALTEHAEWLVKQGAGSTFTPLGREKLDELLQLRGLGVDSQEALAHARGSIEEMRCEEFRIARRAWKLKAFTKESREIAAKSAREQAPLSFEELLAWTEELVAQTHAFAAECDVLPMADDDRVVVAPAPAEARLCGRTFRLTPPMRGADSPTSVLHVAAPASDEDLVRMSVGDLENAIATHVFPGRHLAETWALKTAGPLRSGIPVGAASGFAQLFGDETKAGWDRAAEELMRELQFRDAPASRFLAARRGLERAVLAFVDVKLALGELTFEQACATLVNEADLVPQDATAAVLNLIHRPTSGLSGVLGKAWLGELRRQARDRWHPGYHDRRLHELVLFHGPVPLIAMFDVIDAPPPYTTDEGTQEYALDERPDR